MDTWGEWFGGIFLFPDGSTLWLSEWRSLLVVPVGPICPKLRMLLERRTQVFEGGEWWSPAELISFWTHFVSAVFLLGGQHSEWCGPEHCLRQNLNTRQYPRHNYLGAYGGDLIQPTPRYYSSCFRITILGRPLQMLRLIVIVRSRDSSNFRRLSYSWSSVTHLDIFHLWVLLVLPLLYWLGLIHFCFSSCQKPVLSVPSDVIASTGYHSRTSGH